MKSDVSGDKLDSLLLILLRSHLDNNSKADKRLTFIALPHRVTICFADPQTFETICDDEIEHSDVLLPTKVVC